MRSGTIAFALGILLLLHLPRLPAPGLAALAGALAALCLWPPLRRRGGRLFTAAVAGAGWAWLVTAVILEPGLPAALVGEDVTVVGRVASLPERQPHRLRFEFTVERLQHGDSVHPSPGRIRLAWYDDAPALRAGERWRLTVRLKRPHGMLNPGGFDYERWLLQRRIRATGYVRSKGVSQRLAGAPWWSVDAARQRLGERVRALVGERPRAGLIAALALGDRQGIGDQQWRVLRETGTAHLIAISGLHVGMVAGLVFALVLRVWAWCPPLAARYGAPRAGAWAALFAAALYAAMAGFSLPTQRALVMLAVGLVAVLWGRRLEPGRALAIALLAVLALDPLAVLSPGFWLSFGAVAAILYGVVYRPGPMAGWRQWLRAQLWVVAGLFPLLVWWFRRAALVSPVANLWAIPLTGFVIVPLVLAGTLLAGPAPALAAPLLGLADLALGVLWWGLEHLAALVPSDWNIVVAPRWALLLAAVGIAWLLAPRGWPGRAYAGVLLLPLVGFRAEAPPPGAVAVTALDVGQGLAVVVRTHRHTLLYDAGPRFPSGFDTGRAVVVPFLFEHGLERVDRFVVGHGDNDHSGGARSVVDMVTVGEVSTSAPERLAWAAPRPCRRGKEWRWDGVGFRFLHPAGEGPGDGNDASCVLRIEAGGGTVLLPGDIEAAAEAELVAQRPAALGADVVVMPHHGSTTSSTGPFIEAVAPTYALASTGFNNRYGFPRPSVVARYRAVGARILDTADSGAVTLRIPAQGGSVAVERWREVRQRWWREAGAGS